MTTSKTELAKIPLETRVLNALAKYRGLPLSLVELTQETGAGTRRVNETVRALAERGLVQSKPWGNNTCVYYVEEVEA